MSQHVVIWRTFWRKKFIILILDFDIFRGICWDISWPSYSGLKNGLLLSLFWSFWQIAHSHRTLLLIQDLNRDWINENKKVGQVGPLLLLWLLAKECEKCRRRLSLAQAPSSACKSQGYYFSDREKKTSPWIAAVASSVNTSLFFVSHPYILLRPSLTCKICTMGKSNLLFLRIAVKSCSLKRLPFCHSLLYFSTLSSVLP